MWAFPAAVLLAHLIFLIPMARWLWSRDHYQFYPLVLIGSAVFAWMRLQDASRPDCPVLSVRVVLYGVPSVMLFLLGLYTHSNWLGTLAAIGMLWTVVWFVGGSDIADLLRGPVFLLLLIVPLPLNLDLRLIIELQKLASQAASGLLDLKQTSHTINGVAIRTLDKSFMVEEACSGIHSLMSCVTAVAFWGAIFRYGPIRLILLLAMSVGWVIVANVLRVFVVVYGHARWGLELDLGLTHEMIGVGTYAFAILMSLSSDRLLLFLVPTKNSEALPEAQASEDSLAGQVLAFRKSVRRFLDKSRAKNSLGNLVPIGVVMGACLLMSGITVASRLTAAPPPDQIVFEDSVDSIVSEDSLPTEVSGWKLIDIERIERSADDVFGSNSIIWSYEGRGLTARFSIDGLYPEWHDLGSCYSGSGWKMVEAKNIKSSDTIDTSTHLSMYRTNGQQAFCVFTCLDSQRTVVEPIEPVGTAIRSLMERLESGNLLGETPQAVYPPVFQFQILLTKESTILEHEQQVTYELFTELVRTILDNTKGAK